MTATVITGLEHAAGRPLAAESHADNLHRWLNQHAGELDLRVVNELRIVLADRDFLLRRLAAVCPEHTRCAACGADLCTACAVGDPSSCDHLVESTCCGCDVDYCPACAREAGVDAALSLASEGRYP